MSNDYLRFQGISSESFDCRKNLTISAYSDTEKVAAFRVYVEPLRYSINVKQVVLAFAVEFVIIGLILANQSAIAASLPKATWLSIIMGTSMPIMAELARVPLAICVRTQPSWNIKLVAVAGVMAAVVVTSVNLSLIGWNTYDPRLEEVNQKRVELLRLQDQKNVLASQIAEADAAVQQKRSDRDSAIEQQNRLQMELNKQPERNVVPGQTRTINPDGTTNTRAC